MKNVIKIAHLFLAIVSGLLLIGYGGVDDSPGAQGIGLITILCSLFIGFSLIYQSHQK